MQTRHPLALEEAFARMVLDALRAADCLLIDDLDLVTAVVGCHNYPRIGWLNAQVEAIAAYTMAAGKRLVVVGSAPEALQRRAYPFGIHAFEREDYAALLRAFLGAAADVLDAGKIYATAPSLNAYQLRNSCAWLAGRGGLDTEHFIAYLETQHLTSNVDLNEVQPVDLHDLQGLGDVIESLEANVILPLENDALAAELQLRPKRGVLLAGPPGTGKTTIGRALAHRLKSKFYLVDGTFISGSGDFYRGIHRVFESAMQSGASVLFIDDSDVIFENGGGSGLYRYLLTMLDGLESKSAGRVCVMLTAMEVANLPPALLRSGRIELWLETRLPDQAARCAILAQLLAETAAAVGETDVALLATETEGLTGADLKRLVGDGKLLIARDRDRGNAPRPPTGYFLDALQTLRANKTRYAEAEARANRQRPERPHWFSVPDGMRDEDGRSAIGFAPRRARRAIGEPI